MSVSHFTGEKSMAKKTPGENLEHGGDRRGELHYSLSTAPCQSSRSWYIFLASLFGYEEPKCSLYSTLR